MTFQSSNAKSENVRGATAQDRLTLQYLGWRPIPVVGKAPKAKDWPSGGSTPERVAADNAAVPEATGTGLITGEVVAIDNDLLDGAHALAVEGAIVGSIGDTAFRRFGSKPQPTLFYSNATPIKKITVSGRAPGEVREARVEFLGTGQQCVAFGTHPGTGEPYRWEHEGLFDPLCRGPDDLPEVTPAKIAAAADAAAEMLKQLGYTNVKISGVDQRKTDAHGGKEGSPITLATLKEMLACIDAGCHPNTWSGSVGGALKHAEYHQLVTLADLTTPDTAFVGFEVFHLWSAGKFSKVGAPENYEGREDCEKTWNSLTADRPDGSTLGTIVRLARAGGYRGPIDRTPAETFKDYADRQPGENVELGKPAKVYVLRNGSDIEIADAVLSDLKEKHGELVNCEGSFWHFNCFHWKPLGEPEMYQAIYSYDGIKYGEKGRVKLSKSRCESILHTMRMRTESRDFFRHAPIGINCKSGFIQFEGSAPRLEAHSPDHRQRHLLPGSWQPGAKWNNASLLNTFVQGCFGENSDCAQRILLMGEVFGATALGITPELLSPKAVVLFGPLAANGKSEFLKLARGLLPPSAVSALPPSKFNNDAMLAQLVGKLLNCADELGTTYAIASETFKAIITGNEVTARQLYREPISFSPSALHIFATNVLPPFTGGFDRGVQRRLLPIEFTRVIPERERVPNIGELIADSEADALLAFAVDGASRLLQEKQFTVPLSSRDLLREWVCRADPVIAWLAERTELSDRHRVATKDAYADFTSHAQAEGHPLARLPAANNFVQRVTAQNPRIVSGRTKSVRYLEGFRLLPNEHTHGDHNHAF